MCWRFDRFARSVSHLLRALETYKALGIEFVSLPEQVDTSTPAGKLVFTQTPNKRGHQRAGARRAGAPAGSGALNLTVARVRISSDQRGQLLIASRNRKSLTMSALSNRF